MSNKLDRLYRTLGYSFKNPRYLTQALTHCSAAVKNNERLEFLGDAILSFVIANALYAQYPDFTEGELSRLRAYLVKGDMLAEIALELQLGDFLHLGQGELKSGGFRRASILTDALEAVFAAICLDGGLPASEATILRIYQTRLHDPTLRLNLKDPKTMLQEYLQAKKRTLPEYILTHMTGEEHDQTFHVRCEVAGIPEATLGQGDTRRKAEQQAAQQLLNTLGSRD